MKPEESAQNSQLAGSRVTGIKPRNRTGSNFKRNEYFHHLLRYCISKNAIISNKILRFEPQTEIGLNIIVYIAFLLEKNQYKFIFQKMIEAMVSCLRRESSHSPYKTCSRKERFSVKDCFPQDSPTH